MTEPVTTPWDQATVDRLNDYQRIGDFHPYTCLNRGDGNHTYRTERGGDLGALLATPSGWICGECTYTQGWAHGAPNPTNPVMDLLRKVIIQRKQMDGDVTLDTSTEVPVKRKSPSEGQREYLERGGWNG